MEDAGHPQGETQTPSRHWESPYREGGGIEPRALRISVHVFRFHFKHFMHIGMRMCLFHLTLSSPDRAPVQPRAGSGRPGAAAGNRVPQAWSFDQKPRARMYVRPDVKTSHETTMYDIRWIGCTYFSYVGVILVQTLLDGFSCHRPSCTWVCTCVCVCVLCFVFMSWETQPRAA